MKKVISFLMIIIIGSLFDYLFFSFAAFLFNVDNPFNIFEWITEVKLIFLIFLFIILLAALIFSSDSTNNSEIKVKCPNCENEFIVELKKESSSSSSPSGINLGTGLALGVALGSNISS